MAHRLELAEMIKSLPAELAQAQSEGGGQAIRLQVEDVALELEIAAEEQVEGGIAAKFYVLTSQFKASNKDAVRPKLKRKQIAWADPALDLARIRYPLPDLGVEIPRAEHLVAEPAHKSLAALLGIDLEEDFMAALRAWFPKEFLRILERPVSIKVRQEALALFNQRDPDAQIANPEQLPHALLDTSPRQRVAFVEGVHERLQEQPNPAQNKTLHELAILMLCLVFPDQSALRTVHAQRRRGALIIDSDTVDRLDTEIAMAAAAQARPRTQYQYRGDQLFFPYNVSAEEERSGLDEPVKRA
jgi:hypothetical protein